MSNSVRKSSPFAAATSTSPSSARSAFGKCPSGRASIAACNSASTSARLTASSAPASARRASMASAQAGSTCPRSISALRSASAFSYRPDAVPCDGWCAITSRSKKRRRSDAPPRNTPSIAGVSQISRTRSARSPGVPGAPSIRTPRFDGPLPSSAIPIFCSSSSVAAMVQPPAASCRVISPSCAPRRPRPGPSWLIASSRFVLPAPFAP